MPWIRHGNGLRYDDVPHYNAVEIAQLIANLRAIRNNMPDTVCDQLEELLRTRIASRDLIVRLSKWCEWSRIEQETIARGIGNALFGLYPQPRFTKPGNNDLIDNFQYLYDEWINKISSNTPSVIESQPSGDTMQEYLIQLLENKNVILTGAPGTGKTYLAKDIAARMIFPESPAVSFKELSAEQEKTFKRHYEFVQFHPSYDYTDFVEGLRPHESTAGGVGFSLKNGIFKEFCKKALEAKQNSDNHPFIFIIDEINRGEISKIFGELFFSVDPDYRGRDGRVKTQYANMQKGETVFDINEGQGWFYIPDNVYIIGTMNDIDRSVESFDFAMRRRFVWQEVTAEDSAKNMELAAKVSSQAHDKMRSLNSAIKGIESLGQHYQIGAAYFMKLRKLNNDYKKLWELHLEPLLREYVRALPEPEKVLAELKDAYELKMTPPENEA